MPLLTELVAFCVGRCYKDFAPTELSIASVESSPQANHIFRPRLSLNASFAAKTCPSPDSWILAPLSELLELLELLLFVLSA
jgi:ferredoxin